MQNVFKYMDTSPKGVREFMKSCQDLCKAKYIIAEGKISQVLQSITASKMVFDIVGTSINGFDFSEALIKNIKNNEIECPEEPVQQIALVFCLLFAFDTRQTDFKQFLHTYFAAENPNDELTAFCDKMIVPFANNILRFVKQGGIDAPSNSAEGDNVAVKQEERQDKNFALSNVQREHIISCVNEMVVATEQDAVALPQEKNDVLMVLNGLINVVKTNDKNSIKLLYISVKNTIKNSTIYPSLSMYLDDLSLALQDCDIA